MTTLNPTPITTVSYVLDPKDRIFAVDQAWDACARQDGFEDLTGSRIIGQPLNAFIADIQTTEIFRLLFVAVRQSRRSFNAPFRCDTPTLRRFMALDIEPDVGGWLRVVSAVLATQSRPHVPVLDAATERANEVLRICGWCKKVPLPDGTWVEIEDAVQTLEVLQQSKLPRLSHGLCPECSECLERDTETLMAG